LVISGDLTSLDSVRNLGLKRVISIVSPNSLEMWLFADPLTHLMRILEVFHSNEFWSHFMKSFIFFSKKSSTFLSGSIDTENNLLISISSSKGVKNLLWVVKMTVVSQPGWVWYLVVEES